MGEASLTAMQTGAAQIARMVQVAASSPKVRLHREVAEDLAQLNLRTVDEEHPEALSPALGLRAWAASVATLRRTLCGNRYPRYLARLRHRREARRRPGGSRRSSEWDRLQPRGCAEVNYADLDPESRTPASAERSQPVTVSRSTRSGESPQLVLSDEQRSTLVRRRGCTETCARASPAATSGISVIPNFRGMHPAGDGRAVDRVDLSLVRVAPQLDPITVDLLNDMVEEGWNLAPDQAGRFGFHVPDHMTDVVDALSAVRAERRREQQGSGSWSKPESRASRTVSLPIAPSETPLAADRGPEY